MSAARSALETASGESIQSARLDAEILLAHCLQKNRAYLFTWPERIADPSVCKHFFDLIKQRCEGLPLAYLTGEREFWSLQFTVTPDTLIPRPETELIVELAIDKLHQQPGPLLDLGTGSGAIAISIATEVANGEIDAVDNSPAAISIARQNANRHGVEVNFIESDWFKNIVRTDYQVIVSNPPYIAEDDPHLIRGGLQHEPIAALQAANAGMAAINTIAHNASDYCRPGAWLLIEHGYDQGSQTRQVLQETGFEKVHTEHDLESRDRVTMGQNPA